MSPGVPQDGPADSRVPVCLASEDLFKEASLGGLTEARALGVDASDTEDTVAMQQMIAAVEVILRGLGEDIQRQGILETPRRVAQAMQCAVAGIQFC